MFCNRKRGNWGVLASRRLRLRHGIMAGVDGSARLVGAARADRTSDHRTPERGRQCWWLGGRALLDQIRPQIGEDAHWRGGSAGVRRGRRVRVLNANWHFPGLPVSGGATSRGAPARPDQQISSIRSGEAGLFSKTIFVRTTIFLSVTPNLSIDQGAWASNASP
jgi:hypothetical protein